MAAVLRGQCAVCRYSCRLRKDGSLQTHRDYLTRESCQGSGRPPRPYDPNECGDCMAYYCGTPGLMEAIWSVAIESPKSGDRLAWEFLESYHNSGHVEVA